MSLCHFQNIFFFSLRPRGLTSCANDIGCGVTCPTWTSSPACKAQRLCGTVPSIKSWAKSIPASTDPVTWPCRRRPRTNLLILGRAAPTTNRPQKESTMPYRKSDRNWWVFKTNRGKISFVELFGWFCDMSTLVGLMDVKILYFVQAIIVSSNWY